MRDGEAAGVGSGSGPGVRTRGTLVINADACKGCELCIDACPKDVLVMTEQAVNARGYRYPELMAGCIACQLCSKICPDFVFQVYRFDEPMMVGGEAGGTPAGAPTGGSA